MTARSPNSSSMAVSAAEKNGFPRMDAVRRVILEILADGRARRSIGIRIAVADGLRLPTRVRSRRHAGSSTPIWTNWHAHALKTLQSCNPARALIVKKSGQYRITRRGRNMVREGPLPAEAVSLVGP